MTGAVEFVLVGATGRTGNAVAHAITSIPGVTLSAVVAPSSATGAPRRTLPDGVPAFAMLADVPAGPTVIVDLTQAEHVEATAATALARGMHLVLGTTGVPDDQLMQLGHRFDAAGLGLLYAPNFSIGAVLMMQTAASLARHFESVEVVEIHHAAKVDAPSGTARRTAQLVANARGQHSDCVQQTVELQDRARGEFVDGIAVHSLRLAGAVAHQEVVFGSPGEILTIRHDAIDRSCYAAGVAAAVGAVPSMTGLVVGLEHAL